MDVSAAHLVTNAVGIVPVVGQQHQRFRQIVVHDEIETEIVGRLARRNVSVHRQTGGMHPEMDLGREATL